MLRPDTSQRYKQRTLFFNRGNGKVDFVVADLALEKQNHDVFKSLFEGVRRMRVSLVSQPGQQSGVLFSVRPSPERIPEANSQNTWSETAKL